MTHLSQPGQEILKVAESLARQLFGPTLRALEFVPRGVMNHKFKVTLQGGESFTIRIYPPTREHLVDYEPDLMGRCAGAGLPVPKVLVDSRSGPGVGRSYTVYRWVEGVPLDQRLPNLAPRPLTQITQDLLHFLQGLARLPVAGYGDLLSASRASFHTRSEFFAAAISDCQSALTRGHPDRETLIRLSSLLQKAGAAMTPEQPVLAWGDVSPENILLDPADRIVGVIDFEGTLAGDFSLTLGYAYARFFQTPFFEALSDVWPKNGHPPAGDHIKIYAALRALRLAPFATGPMPTGHPRTPLRQVLPGLQYLLEEIKKHDH